MISQSASDSFYDCLKSMHQRDRLLRIVVIFFLLSFLMLAGCSNLLREERVDTSGMPEEFLYPEAEGIGRLSEEAGGILLKFEADDHLEEVEEYYREKPFSQGWSEGVKETGKNYIRYLFGKQKGDELQAVEVRLKRLENKRTEIRLIYKKEKHNSSESEH